MTLQTPDKTNTGVITEESVIRSTVDKMTILYQLFMAIQNRIFALRAFFLSFLPRHLQAKINLVHDSLLVMGVAFIARLLPSLRPYLAINKANSAKLSGKNVIVTGANSGIGKQIATDLLRLGATVYLACRNEKKGEDATEDILWSIPGARPRLRLLTLDTSDLDSVKALAENWRARPARQQHIDILVHNAGTVHFPTTGENGPYSPQGLHLLYATNFLGSFVLTQLLEDCLADDARVIFTSSPAQYAAVPSSDFATSAVKHGVEPGFHVNKQLFKTGTTQTKTPTDTVSVTSLYAHTKLQQTIFAYLLQQRWNRQVQVANQTESKTENHVNETRTRRLAFSFSPGYTSTAIIGKISPETLRKDPTFAFLSMFSRLATPVTEGSATGTWLAITQDGDVVGADRGGDFWDRMTRRASPVDVMSQKTLERYWQRWCADGDVQWK